MLFVTLLSVAEEIGMANALECLERSVIEKRIAWLNEFLSSMEITGRPLADAYKIFYEKYLGISSPNDGQIVESTEYKLVTRWWNDCPLLDACQKFGLDTREVCRRAYHRPVQVFLEKIDPRLGFSRNYEALRPYASYCEEVITLADCTENGIA